MARKFTGYVIDNEILAKDIFRLKIESDSLTQIANVGQFVNIKCSNGLEHLLRRPISLMDVDKENGTFDLGFQVKGEGTKFLSEKKKGDSLDIIGPSGNYFDLNSDYKKVAIIGGGIGVFPLYYLLKNLKSCKKDVFLGFRQKQYVIMEDEFKMFSDDLYIGTDDGSYGYKGFIINYFKMMLEKNRYDIIYACGPTLMLKGISNLAKDFNINCQISLEQRMGCGIGACLVCACKIKMGKKWEYKHVCKDGPVFWSDEVIFDE